jgi:UDP-2-acetamido-3-amino-2,3-dideoxy-glucuronate N-acetyltransferase
MTYFVHHLADCQSKALGIGTTLWQLTVVPAMARVGSNYNISCHCFIENGIAIGDKVTFKSGVYLRDGVTLDNDVFVGPNATFTNDKVPRSKREYEQLKTLVCEGASIGAGAVCYPEFEVVGRRL